MPFQLNLKSAEETRVQITEQQQKYIEKLYTDLAKKIEKEAQKAPKTATDYLRREFLNDLRESVDKELTEIRHLIQSKVEDSMERTAEGVVESNREFLKEFDLPVRMALAHIPPDIVREVATGQLYEGNWSLARQLWKQEKHTQSDINKVIAEGIAANKSAYDIAKDLEKYVDPKARKEWDWSKVYPGTAKKIDYNAQRLARTMVSHAYERAFVESTKDNPFVTEYEWRASGARSCPLCMERDGQHFAKDDLPLDHPNGMCTFIAVIPDDYIAIADRLADWASGEEDAALDKYAEKLYGKDWFSTVSKPKEATKPSTNKTMEITRDAKWVDKNYSSLKKSVTDIYGKDTWERLQEDILSKPPEIQDWIQRWTNKVRFAIDGDKTCYRTGTIVEQMSKDAAGGKSLTKRHPFSSFYHELGHHIDQQVKGHIVQMSGSKSGQTFYEILQKEYKGLLDSNGKLQTSIRQELKANDNTSGVQDAISGLSLNKNRVRWGHDNEYWTRRNGSERWKEVTNETFANMHLAYCNPGSDQEKAFQKYFPESYKFFKDEWVYHPELFYKKG